ncbi:MAG: glycosyltransferase family 4 protein [Syntrophobacteraceae bacterium]|nr:glycosyltransferase family 4 protein [Syntrophobacteraceae bacterium]
MAKILFLIIGFHKPSSRKRVLDSRAYLGSRGHEVTVREVPKGGMARAALFAGLRRHDLVVIQKKLFGRVELGIISMLNSRLVYDFDDAVMFHEIERNEPLRGKYFTRFTAMCGRCRGVIAGNGTLAELARLARGVGESDPSVLVLPTPVDTGAIVPRAYGGSRPGLRIGWMGTRGNLGHLMSIAAPLGRVMSAFPGSELVVVTDGAPRFDGMPVRVKPWSAVDETDDLRSFDVGIMPLRDNLWTRGKGGFKLLQYMAAGVAAVASPVGINGEIIEHGENGFLAGSEIEWEEWLRRLLEDPELRRRLGMNGRATVESRFALTTYHRRLAEFLEGLL